MLDESTPRLLQHREKLRDPDSPDPVAVLVVPHEHAVLDRRKAHRLRLLGAHDGALAGLEHC